MRSRSVLLALAVLAGAARSPAGEAQPASQPATCAEQIARRVQQRYERIRDLEARFEQWSVLASLGEAAGAEISRGVVTLSKPGRMRWAYEEPEPSLVVSDGETLWTYDPGLGEAQRLPVSEEMLDGAAVQFLLGRGDVLRAFQVSGERCSPSPVSLVLTPREPASFERLEILVEAETGEIRETKVFDLFGNRTRVRFEDVVTNRDPPAELFRFAPPPGVTVLEAGP